MYFMLDNYDSFVYNLSAYFEELGQKILVKRADQITVAEVEELQPEGIVISPGPGKPSEAHLSHALLERFAGEIPILGVCLGHQVIVEKYHGRVEKGTRPMHGKVTPITHTGEGIFRRASGNLLCDQISFPCGKGRTPRLPESDRPFSGWSSHGSGTSELSRVRSAVSSGGSAQ